MGNLCSKKLRLDCPSLNVPQIKCIPIYRWKILEKGAPNMKMFILCKKSMNSICNKYLCHFQKTNSPVLFLVHQSVHDGLVSYRKSVPALFRELSSTAMVSEIAKNINSLFLFYSLHLKNCPNMFFCMLFSFIFLPQCCHLSFIVQDHMQ